MERIDATNPRDIRDKAKPIRAKDEFTLASFALTRQPEGVKVFFKAPRLVSYIRQALPGYEIDLYAISGSESKFASVRVPYNLQRGCGWENIPRLMPTGTRNGNMDLLTSVMFQSDPGSVLNHGGWGMALLLFPDAGTDRGVTITFQNVIMSRTQARNWCEEFTRTMREFYTSNIVGSEHLVDINVVNNERPVRVTPTSIETPTARTTRVNTTDDDGTRDDAFNF